MTRQRGRVAIVLHAHLPYVRSVAHDEDVEERWLYEALWESYLPLLSAFERAAERAPARALLTLSVSPTLLAMLADPHHRAGFDAYADRLEEVAARARRHASLSAGIDEHVARLRSSKALHVAARGDLTAALVALASRGVIELMTTSATHAFLPSLLTPAAVRAQLRIGQRYFRAKTGAPSAGLWLPECGYSESFGADLGASGVRFTVLEAHGIDLARPRPEPAKSPIVAPSGVTFFARDPELVARVWSREHGFPGAAVYREFHCDVADLVPAAELGGWLGPTGLRPLRVTGGAGPKEPYDPSAARRMAKEHAHELAASAVDALARSASPDPIVVLAFDAELFGHWWWEGPEFLEELLAALGPRATSLGAWLSDDPALPVAEPATSSWGEGGFAEVWTHPASAHVLRAAHRAERRVLCVDALVRDTPRTPVQRDARLWAIRELLELQASDYPFMLRLGQSVDFAARRVREHAQNVERLTDIASSPTTAPADADFVRAVASRRPLFRELDEDAFADALDPFE